MGVRAAGVHCVAHAHLIARSMAVHQGVGPCPVDVQVLCSAWQRRFRPEQAQLLLHGLLYSVLPRLRLLQETIGRVRRFFSDEASDAGALFSSGKCSRTVQACPSRIAQQLLPHAH